MALDNPDLRLFSLDETQALSEEQRERMLIIFTMLVSLFERVYPLLFETKMSSKQQRRWSSWDDYMREWCQREDFRVRPPQLLRGEDPEFVAYIESLATISGCASATGTARFPGPCGCCCRRAVSVPELEIDRPTSNLFFQFQVLRGDLRDHRP